jgi:hypothetical protein
MQSFSNSEQRGRDPTLGDLRRYLFLADTYYRAGEGGGPNGDLTFVISADPNTIPCTPPF